MTANVLFDTKAEFRLRIIPKPCNSISAGRKDRVDLAQLETDARRVFKHEGSGGPDPGISAKAERGPMLVLVELICQG